MAGRLSILQNFYDEADQLKEKDKEANEKKMQEFKEKQKVREDEMWEKIKKSNDKAQHLLDELENYKEETKK